MSGNRTLKSWDAYWRGTGDVGAYSSGGVSHPAVVDFWDAWFRLMAGRADVSRLVDMATGNGAVIERALEHFTRENIDITCVDIAEGAIDNIHARFPGVRGVVADARAVPLDSGAFDLVTSQFGVEYAGVDAICETARLVAPGGSMALLLHIERGSIHKECDDSLNAIERLKAAKFVPYARQFFEAGFIACHGGDREPYDTAGKTLSPAIREAEAIIADFGEHVAGDTIARLYEDVGRIHNEIQSYEPQEVLDWLAAMETELEAYAGRMSSMTDSSIDRETFARICENLKKRGLRIERGGPLLPVGADRPVAWALIAVR